MPRTGPHLNRTGSRSLTVHDKNSSVLFSSPPNRTDRQALLLQQTKPIRQNNSDESLSSRLAQFHRSSSVVNSCVEHLETFAIFFSGPFNVHMKTAPSYCRPMPPLEIRQSSEEELLANHHVLHRVEDCCAKRDVLHLHVLGTEEEFRLCFPSNGGEENRTGRRNYVQYCVARFASFSKKLQTLHDPIPKIKLLAEAIGIACNVVPLQFTALPPGVTKVLYSMLFKGS